MPRASARDAQGPENDSQSQRLAYATDAVGPGRSRWAHSSGSAGSPAGRLRYRAIFNSRQPSRVGVITPSVKNSTWPSAVAKRSVGGFASRVLTNSRAAR